MMDRKSNGLTFIVIVVLVTVSLGTFVAAQTQQIQGVINGRTGSTMTVQTETGNVVVLLTNGTEVRETSGMFHTRKKEMAMTALVPGLQVQVKGAYGSNNQLIADSVTFNGNALKTATDIQAGVTPLEQQQQAQQQQLAQQEAKLQQEQAQQAADEAKIAANQAAIAAVNKRFGELGDYNIWDQVTIYFGNGQTKVDPKYDQALLALCQKAKTVTGYVVQVQGYASKVGSAALNQKLSQERAANVVQIVEQQGGIPLTNMLAPGAMGTSQQVAPDTTSEGQAENRRVVVRVLQNKGIAGM